MPISTREGKSFPGDTFTEGNRKFKSTDLVHSDYTEAFGHAERMISSKHGRVDAIVFETRVKGTPRFLVYLSRRKKEDRTIPAEDAAKIEYEISAFDRKIHINSMYDAGWRGIQDMSKFASRFIVLPPASPALSAKSISPDHDILGFDHPRKDIFVEKTNAGKTMRTGGNTFAERSMLANAARVVLDRNFTKAEVRKMNLYFEANDPDLQGAAGTCSVHEGGGMPVSTVSVRKDQVYESVVTHEIVHALRSADGRSKWRDMDSEEIETEYETTLRLQKPRTVSGCGYYQYMPEFYTNLEDTNWMADAALADRVLATGATDKPLKGRRLTHDIVPNTIMNSRIATAQPALRKRLAEKRTGSYQMIAEDVDTYFQIKLPDKSTVEYHIRFNEARPSLAKIKKHLKEKFGKNIEAWEWKDGKRVRLISRSKKRTTTNKRTTKKATTRKTPSKRRIPMTKTPNQYLKGIPPIPGGFV